MRGRIKDWYGVTFRVRGNIGTGLLLGLEGFNIGTGLLLGLGVRLVRGYF